MSLKIKKQHQKIFLLLLGCFWIFHSYQKEEIDLTTGLAFTNIAH